MPRRDVLTVALLTIVTCGFYGIYWQYKTTEELAQATGKPLNPVVELLLSFLTCGIFAIYARYRNAQLVTERMRTLRNNYEDRAVLILVLDIAGVFTGVTFLAATLILQDEFNKLAEASAVQTLTPVR